MEQKIMFHHIYRTQIKKVKLNLLRTHGVFLLTYMEYTENQLDR